MKILLKDLEKYYYNKFKIDYYKFEIINIINEKVEDYFKNIIKEDFDINNNSDDNLFTCSDDDNNENYKEFIISDSYYNKKLEKLYNEVLDNNERRKIFNIMIIEINIIINETNL